LKEKVPIDTFLKEDAPKAFQKLTELAKKAEELDNKKAAYISKIKHKLHPTQMRYYMTPEQVKAKWSKWNENHAKEQDPVVFMKKVAVDQWAAEKTERESRMKTN